MKPIIFIIILVCSNVLSIENRKKSLRRELGYNPAELLTNIFSLNITNTESRQNKIKFDNNYNDGNQYKEKSKIQFEADIDDNVPIDDDDEQDITEFNTTNSFHLNDEEFRSNKDFKSEDEDASSDFKRRKNWKRRPRLQFHNNQDLSFNQYGLLTAPSQQAPSGLGQATDVLPGNPGYYSYGLAEQYPGYPSKINPFVPNEVTSGALSAIVEAFTSVAENDDYQCVPRLLCETAGGAVGSNKILESVNNLQPLFGMLAKYQGLSTSPLFLFGRAVFLGMTSKGNPSSCRYAYPQCPTDPDKLVYYLNNHKGGFFRFFSSINTKPDTSKGQNFQSYGLYKPLNSDHNGLYNSHKKYGGKYSYDKRNEDNDSNIARIQNKPLNDVSNNNNFDGKTKWLFPGDVNYDDNVREVKDVKFPAQDSEEIDYIDNENNYYNRKGKTIAFPDKKINNQYNNKLYSNYNTNNNKLFNNIYSKYTDDKEDYVFDYVHNFYVKREKKKVKNADNDGNTVYIVRGHGDPRHPEVVKLRPGESVQ